jgi:hypothetical protein
MNSGLLMMLFLTSLLIILILGHLVCMLRALFYNLLICLIFIFTDE